MTAVIAIDGPAGAGKSTVAKAIAKRLDWSYLDTGAMYRAVTWLAIQSGVALSDDVAVAALAKGCDLTLLPRVMINDVDVTDEIRRPEVNVGVSTVAALASVREEMVRRQRDFAIRQPRGTVVEGRDITTVVFPDATVKVYLTASPDERARRRGDEGAASIARRDHADQHRDVSPLRQAEDALVVDTTGRSVDDIVEEIASCVTRNSN